MGESGSPTDSDFGGSLALQGTTHPVGAGEFQLWGSPIGGVFVLVVSNGPATVEEVNGIGLNPTIFATLTSPVLGTEWVSTVDGGLVGVAGGLTFVFGTFETFEPGIVVGVGEVLVDPLSGTALLDVAVLSAWVATHSVPVPDDVALLGTSITAQAFVNATPSGAGQLGNALRLTFSSF